MAADWTTIASLATAAGTMVLAIATFVSVRSANRAARIAEQGFLLGQRPLLMPSRLDDPTVKVMWVDEHWAHVDGGRASVELVDGVVVGFWQAAVRERDDPDRAWLESAVVNRSIFLVHLLYSDHEGAQRAIGTFALAPGKDEQWLCSSVRHRNLDRPNPR